MITDMTLLTMLSCIYTRILACQSVRLTVLPHFYYQAAQWACNNVINMFLHTEILDKSYGESRWRNEFDVDLFSITVPTYFLQLGGEKIRKDYKIAKHYLDLQERASRSYDLRRHHFFLVAVVHNDKRPTRTFLDKNTHIIMKSNFHQNKHTQATPTFIRLFDAAFKSYYTNIMQEIERFVSYNTPLEYTQRHATDSQNLYYYNDNCTIVGNKF
jgi:hypothetical protein